MVMYNSYGDYMKPLKKISITVDSHILTALRIEAEKDDRSLSQYINLILKEHIKNRYKEKMSRNSAAHFSLIR